jgi:hypothetical protein
MPYYDFPKYLLELAPLPPRRPSHQQHARELRAKALRDAFRSLARLTHREG